MKKEIKIKCQGAATAKLSELIPIQGDLKKISVTRLEKLKKQIVSAVFALPSLYGTAKENMPKRNAS